MKKLILLIIIAAAIYYGYQYIKPTNENSSDLNNDPAAEQNTPLSWQTYQHQGAINYSVQYPVGWQVVNAENSTTFMPLDDNQPVDITLYTSSDPLPTGTQTTKTIANQQVMVINNADNNKASVIFNLGDQGKLVATGQGEIFNKMLETLIIGQDNTPPTTIDDKETTPSTTDDNTNNNDAAPVINDNNNTDETTTPVTPTDNTAFTTADIRLFYTKTDSGDDCQTVYPVNRDLDTRYNTDEVNALVTLLTPLSAEETTAGYTTSIPSDTRLRRLDISDGVATADFNESLNSGGGSCMMALRRAQITQTLLQFPDINEVIITVNGSADTALQP
ncbi:MAG: GerMN domain-containing protein [Candidatus Komeilibacteria bacterium]